MKYIRALQMIGAKVGDPGLLKVKDLARMAFVDAITSLVVSGDYLESDIPAHVLLKTDLSFSSNPYDAQALSLLKVIDIMPDPATINDFTFYQKDFTELKMVSQLTEVQPQVTEVFYYQVGLKIYVMYHATSNYTPASDTLYMKYVTQISDAAWTDASDLQLTPIFFSTGITRKAITLAAESLSIEEKE